MSTPKGYKLVPVEPTEEMLEVGHEAYRNSSFDEALVIYCTMIDSAPSTTQPIYDEEKERELFKAVYFRCDLSEDWLSGAFKDKQTRDMWDGWRECAQSRAKAVEVSND